MTDKKCSNCMYEDFRHTVSPCNQCMSYEQWEAKSDKFAALKLAYHQGAAIQILRDDDNPDDDESWGDCEPQWALNREYRVKPVPPTEDTRLRVATQALMDSLVPYFIIPQNVADNIEAVRQALAPPAKTFSIIGQAGVRQILGAGTMVYFDAQGNNPNLRLTFDSTDPTILKDAEVLK